MAYVAYSGCAEVVGGPRVGCGSCFFCQTTNNRRAALQPENTPLTLVQKWLRKMRDYMTAYEDGADGQTADSDL